MSDSIEEKKSFIDLDLMEYDEYTLMFLRKKLDDFTISVFIQVVKETKQNRGLVKARMENFHSMRKRYDAAFLILEYQGFIERKEDGTATPYYVTARGAQLAKLIKNEENQKTIHAN